MQRTLVLTLLAALALNAGLALRLLQGRPATRDEKPAAPVHMVAPVATPTLDADVWPNLQPGDLPSLVARLRAEDFPPNLIRAIVSARLTAQFAERRMALDPDADQRSFWKDHPPNAKLELALRRLDFEQAKILRQLLGDDSAGDDLWSRRSRRDAWTAALPAEKAVAAKRVRDSFDDRRFEIAETDFGSLQMEAKLAALDKEQQAAMAGILTPRELETYDLYAGNTANRLRSRLGLFQPSEQEFRALYDLQRVFDQRFADYALAGPPTEEQQRERAEALRQLREQSKAALGPQRATEYERATDSSYQQTARLVARLDLPADAAAQVWSLQKDIQEQAKKIRDDRALSEPQRTAQLSALATDASGRITGALGARGFEAYKDNAGGWLVDLTKPRPGLRF